MSYSIIYITILLLISECQVVLCSLYIFFFFLFCKVIKSIIRQDLFYKQTFFQYIYLKNKQSLSYEKQTKTLERGRKLSES